MKVYVVLEDNFDSAGYIYLGVFSTEELAHAFIKGYTHDNKWLKDRIIINEEVLNEPS